MVSIQWDRPWVRYVGAAIAYAVVFSFLHLFYAGNWQLTAGFRLACLLLVPRRYWPSLFIGEAIGLGHLVYSCVGQLGMPWAVATLIASMTLAMPAVFLFRKYLPVIDANKRAVIGSLLLCFLTATLLQTVANILEFALMQGRSLLPEQLWSAAHVSYFSYLWFLGTSLGIYMVVPLVLWVYTEDLMAPQNLHSRIVRSPVLREVIVTLLPYLCLLAYITQYVHSEPLKHTTQVAMLLAPFWMARRFGWQGASLGSALANLTLVLSLHVVRNPTTLHIQELMMTSSTLWLLYGARISVIRLHYAQVR